ncbi:hypothetical protein HQN64_21800 [Enterobacteriaceae bacterium BIT-l23]|uniref:Outer membrane protein with beta-barrel domain n=1 Tax=Jejubacter calystegiae TaxID=2579935 RepID=A0A4P8YQH3_9ENTR|nr:oligogalacturonate-specific porin KdgM family protein [Jejubacter calystegiae]NUU68715.1 hypothetical protein [Enterobacteriaceae bacterium BIT-l23]QCT22376.1 hypothetical protein FEM41_23390 [Jejubacter calystegiae]
MKYLISLLLFLCGAAHHACALELKYYHEIADVDKIHKESLGISHGFSNGFGAGLEYKRAARESGVAAWSHGGHDELKYHLKQRFRLSSLLDVTPEMGWSRKTNARKYKPQLKFSYSYAKHQKLSLMYRYEIKRSTGKPRKQTQMWQLMNGYKIDRVSLSYGIKYKKSNQTLYRGHREDAEGKLQISYRLTDSLAPFIEFKNTSVSSSSAHRQTMLKAGFVWRML